MCLVNIRHTLIDQIMFLEREEVVGGRGYLCHPCIANLWVLIDDDRNVSYQELEDLRSEHGDNHHGQPDDEEEYQRRFSSVSGPDNQVKRKLSTLTCPCK